GRGARVTGGTECWWASSRGRIIGSGASQDRGSAVGPEPPVEPKSASGLVPARAEIEQWPPANLARGRGRAGGLGRLGRLRLRARTARPLRRGARGPRRGAALREDPLLPLAAPPRGPRDRYPPRRPPVLRTALL